jgi:hypothetical protein
MYPSPSKSFDQVVVWTDAATCATAHVSKLSAKVAGANPEPDPSWVVAEEEAVTKVEELPADKAFLEE